ncbi:MAG: hypothetical protein ACOX2K_05070 [Bacillota bacterium]|jgi:hypothetical protein
MNWTKLQNIDRRIIYVLLLLVTSIPLLSPLGMPLQVNPMTEAVYNIIEDLDPAKDVVLLSFDYGPGAGLDAHVVPTVVVDHLTTRGIKWVSVSFAPEGPMMADQIIAGLEQRGYKYGEDFANLGYMAGEENAIRLFALDSQVIPTDTRGNKVADLPMMKNIKTVKDFAFVHQFTSNDPVWWIRQAVDPMGIRFAAGVVTVSVPSAMPYYNSGQMVGLLGGLRASAEYELLINKPGRGLAMMDAQSMGHLLIIGFIVLGNIGYFLSKKQK